MIQIAREIERVLSLNTGEVGEQSSLLDIENMDSLTFEMLLLRLEEISGLEIGPDIFLEWRRVSDIQSWIDRALP